MYIQISYDDGIEQDSKIEEIIQKVCDEVSRVYGLEDDELSILLCYNKMPLFDFPYSSKYNTVYLR